MTIKEAQIITCSVMCTSLPRSHREFRRAFTSLFLCSYHLSDRSNFSDAAWRCKVRVNLLCRSAFRHQNFSFFLFRLNIHINMSYYRRDEKHSRHVQQHFTMSFNNPFALVLFFILAFFTLSFFIFGSQRCRLKTARCFQRTPLVGGSSDGRKNQYRAIPRTDDPRVDRSIAIAKGTPVPSLPRGRDPCLCWPAVGVALSWQALLSASSMKSAIARNCLELAQSNHPPFPVRVRVYINR